MNYFNEFDETACAVLRHCYDGVVDERSIKEVKPGDLQGYERVHFFAGAGLWQVACDLAGWRRPIWTGSCPCQGESVAGKRLGAADPRDLWPDFFTLIAACRPPVVVGEQVDAAVSSHWLDRAASDMEDAGYAFRAVDIPACTVDAPHKRNRIYWVAVDNSETRRRMQRRCDSDRSGVEAFRSSSADTFSTVADANGRNASAERQQLRGEQRFEPSDGNDSWIARDAQWAEVTVADADRGGRDRGPQNTLGRAGRRDVAERADGDVGDAFGAGLEGQRWNGDGAGWAISPRSASAPNGSFWSGADWLRCADGKARRAKPGIRLLVDGFSRRADLWRLAGNAIVAPLAAEILAALQETLDAAEDLRSVRVDDLFG